MLQVDCGVQTPWVVTQGCERGDYHTAVNNMQQSHAQLTTGVDTAERGRIVSSAHDTIRMAMASDPGTTGTRRAHGGHGI